MEYDGSRYDGWQKQVNSQKSNTIQDKVEAVLNKMEGETIVVTGGARTEPGVHALAQTANFKTASRMPLIEIKRYLNRFLPMDIAVLEAEEVSDRFHAALSAKAFVYEYHITVGEVPSVFDRKYSYYSFKVPDRNIMKEAAEGLCGTHDLKAFSDNKRMKKSTVRTIEGVDISGDEKEIILTVKADDFWPHLARIIAGTLLEIGKGTMKADCIGQILAAGDREKAGPTAEAKGLFLASVLY